MENNAGIIRKGDEPLSLSLDSFEAYYVDMYK